MGLLADLYLSFRVDSGHTFKGRLGNIHLTCSKQECRMCPLDVLPAGDAVRLEHDVARLRLEKQRQYEVASELMVMYQVQVPIVPSSTVPYWQHFLDEGRKLINRDRVTADIYRTN